MDFGAPFTITLPDSPEAVDLGDRMSVEADLRVDHPSGRPWLLARTCVTPMVVFQGAESRAVLVGPTSATEADLAGIMHQARRFADLPSQLRRFDGSFLIFVTGPEGIYASGPASETRRVFHADLGGTIALADRADLLGDLRGSKIDTAAVAFRLVLAAPYPFSDLQAWEDVHAIPGSEYAVVGSNGHLRTEVWWKRPQPELGRVEGARRLREALANAVAVRTRSGSLTASDLSGGLDSTPVCFFAAQGPHGVLARTLYGDDPGGREDLDWARRAVVSMPGVHTHDVLDVASAPGFYGGLEDARVRLDEPSQVAMAVPRIVHMLRMDERADITLHFHGAGGDHLLRGMPMWNHTLARRRPLLAWNRARSDAVAKGIGPLTTLRQILGRASYAEWVHEVLGGSANEDPLAMMPGLDDWGGRAVFPTWLSRSSRDLIDDRVSTVGDELIPLGTDRASHLDLLSIREAGHVVRGMDQIGQGHGVNYDGPLLDDHVVEAVLSVRHEERDTPVEWKPLMKEAMRGLLPDDYLLRTNKVGGSPQAVRGYADHYEQVSALWEESGLLDSGLIDVEELFNQAKPSPTEAPPSTLHQLTAVAVFLRNQAQSRIPATKG